jgi:NAD(P)-dependent dehydrogenase (short-subunit alcohol dehydrogenase family)
MMNLIDLTGKTIVVAGASSGIGKKTAIVLSKIGARLILIARREDRLIETISELEGSGHSYYVADLSQVNDIENLVKGMIKENGPVDGLVYSTGISLSSPFSLAKPDKIEKSFQVNFFGFMELTRQLTKKNHCNPGMSVVGISSSASLMGDKGQSVYAATKAAMNGAMRCMAHEFGEKQIRINTIAPGMTATEMYEGYIKRNGEDSNSNQNLLKRQYLGIVSTDAIAYSAAFLLSECSSYITGVVLPVDGGMTSC